MSTLQSKSASELRARLAAGLLPAVLMGATACAPDEAPPTAGPEVLRDGVDMVIIDMEHYLTRLGVRRGRLLADTAEYVSENEIHLRPVELVFYDDEGREVSLLTADFGVFNEVSEDMEATGNVVVVDRRDDGRLETEQIRYTKEEDRLYGDRRFMYESNGGRTVMRGNAFESDPGLDRIVTVLPEGSSEPRIDTVTVEPLVSVADTASGGEEARGSLLEAAPDSVAAAQDSLAASESATIDSTAVVPDTTSRDTTAVRQDSTVRDTTVRSSGSRDSTASAGRRERAGAGAR